MDEENWLVLLATVDPLIGAATGALWTSFSPRNTQQRLKEALEVDGAIPEEYKVEWRTHLDYLIASEVFNDRLVLQGALYIALGYASTVLGAFTGGGLSVVFSAVGGPLMIIGVERVLQLGIHVRRERRRLLAQFSSAREVGHYPP